MVKRSPLKSQLGSQLGSILTRTWQQLEGVREVVAQKTKVGRLQLDLTLMRRRRKDALASLGEVVARLARSGRIDEEDFPELSAPLANLSEIEDKIEREEQRARNVAAGMGDDMYPADYEEGDREEYDEDDDSSEERGARRREWDEDSQREAAGRRLHGELDYDEVLDENDDDLDDEDDEDEDEA
jgi:hypothetical protein